MTEPTYPLAREAAATVAAQLARHRAAAPGMPEMAPQADAHAVEAITNAAFWASLRREEGRSPKISLAFLPPTQAGQPLLFERRLPLIASALTQLAPAVERPGIHLGVWRDADELYVWGATSALPHLCFVLEVVEPGLLVIKYSRGEAFGKFANVAVLEGDRIKVVDERSARRPDCPVLLASLVGLDPSASWLAAANVLVQLAVSMRAHGHGGSVLVVPDGAGRWRESVVWPMPYAMAPPFSRLAALMRRDPAERSGQAWQRALRRAIDGVAGLTAVDGATVMNRQYEVLAFGAIIKRSDMSTPVERVVLMEPIEGDLASIVSPARVGGTRHLSAAQFVHDQRDALALVASQDGRFTIFTWSEADKLVHAHRIETLLL
jgi:hypothetical protein